MGTLSRLLWKHRALSVNFSGTFQRGGGCQGHPKWSFLGANMCAHTCLCVCVCLSYLSVCVYVWACVSACRVLWGLVRLSPSVRRGPDASAVAVTWEAGISSDASSSDMAAAAAPLSNPTLPPAISHSIRFKFLTAKVKPMLNASHPKALRGREHEAGLHKKRCLPNITAMLRKMTQRMEMYLMVSVNGLWTHTLCIPSMHMAACTHVSQEGRFSNISTRLR